MPVFFSLIRPLCLTIYHENITFSNDHLLWQCWFSCTQTKSVMCVYCVNFYKFTHRWVMFCASVWITFLMHSRKNKKTRHFWLTKTSEKKKQKHKIFILFCFDFRLSFYFFGGQCCQLLKSQKNYISCLESKKIRNYTLLLL